MEVIYDLWPFVSGQTAAVGCPTVREVLIRLFPTGRDRGWYVGACDCLVGSGHCELAGFICSEVREGMAIRTTASLFEEG